MMSTPEEEFEQWARRQSYESQRDRLEYRLDRMEWAEIAAYLLIFVWVAGLFVAFQLGWVTAYLAAIVTAWVLIAGVVVVFVVRRQQASLREKITALDQEYADVADEDV